MFYIKIKKYESIEYLDTYSFSDVIQINHKTAENYICNKAGNIELENERDEIAVYNSTELLKSILKLGDKFFNKLKINPRHDGFNNIKKISVPLAEKYFNLEKYKIPFEIIEGHSFVKKFDESKTEILLLIRDWCKKYGTPFKGIEVYKKNKFCYILDCIGIENFVIKATTIYCINHLMELIYEIDNHLNNSDYYLAKKLINELNSLINRSFGDLESFNEFKKLRANFKNPQSNLDIIYNIKVNIEKYINSWNIFFSNNLLSYLFYDKSKDDYYNLLVSDDVTDLAWNEFIFQTSRVYNNNTKSKCDYCGKEFNLNAEVKTGQRQKYCSEHKKMSSKYRDTKNIGYKKDIKKYLKDKNISIELKIEIKELLKYSDRSFPVKRYKKLVKKISSL